MNSLPPHTPPDLCASLTPVLVIQAVFTLFLGPFTFFDVQKTKYLQILTSLMRWAGESALPPLSPQLLGTGRVLTAIAGTWGCYVAPRARRRLHLPFATGEIEYQKRQ